MRFDVERGTCLRNYSHAVVGLEWPFQCQYGWVLGTSEFMVVVVLEREVWMKTGIKV